MKTVNIENLARDVIKIESETEDIRSRYYMLETRIKTIMEMLAQKMT